MDPLGLQEGNPFRQETPRWKTTSIIFFKKTIFNSNLPRLKLPGREEEVKEFYKARTFCIKHTNF